jgi:intracellular septation protein A
MTLELIVATLLPLILYVVVEFKRGPRAATITAMVSVVVLAAYLYFRFDVLDETYLVELFLILGLGAVSLKMQNSTWFKFQPMATGVIFALYGFYLQVFGTPFLLKMEPMLEKVAIPQMLTIMKSEEGRALFSSMSLELSSGIFLHALACGYAAHKLSSVGWLLTRIAIYPLLLGYFVLRWIPFLVSHMPPG